MRTHDLKILEDFADSVLKGDKTFEIRQNDRGFQKGDCVKFKAINGNTGIRIPHPIETRMYEITYVLSGWGLKNGYVVFGIKEKEPKGEYTEEKIK